MEEITLAHMQFGSHVYGTNTPDSDMDFKAVFIPSTKDLLLQRATKVSRNRSTGNDRSKNQVGDIDVEEFSLHGFMKLACEGQTVAIDMLFVPEAFYTGSSNHWRIIVGNRDKLISRSIAPFVGYCRSQANKYGIKGSRMAAAKAAVEVFQDMQTLPRPMAGRARVIDFQHMIEDRLLDREHIEIESRYNREGHEVKHLSVCGKLAPFTLPIEKALEMYQHLWQRYGERSRAAMNNEGIDWKALMHARRIQDQACELLDTGVITFPRHNADALLKIRLGERPYKEVAEEIENGMEQLDVAMESSKLPNSPDREWADARVVACYAEAIGQHD